MKQEHPPFEELPSAIYPALELLVKGMRERQKEFKSIIGYQYGCNDPLAVMKEFCTLKISGTRRMGHTNAIFLAMKNDLFKKALVIVHNNVYCKHIKLITRTYCPDKDIYVIHQNCIDTHIRGMLVDVVFVDPACFFSTNKIDRIYKELAPLYQFTRNLTIVFLE